MTYLSSLFNCSSQILQYNFEVRIRLNQSKRRVSISTADIAHDGVARDLVPCIGWNQMIR